MSSADPVALDAISMVANQTFKFSCTKINTYFSNPNCFDPRHSEKINNIQNLPVMELKSISREKLILCPFSLFSACAESYNLQHYAQYRDVNSQINEQRNSSLKKLKSQLSYMTKDNFISHCKLFFWHRNRGPDAN